MMNVVCSGRILLQFLLATVIGNSVAHELARQAMVEESSCVWIDDPPASIRQLLVNDVTIFSNQ